MQNDQELMDLIQQRVAQTSHEQQVRVKNLLVQNRQDYQDAMPARYTKNLRLLATYLEQPTSTKNFVFDVFSDVHTDGADQSLPENYRFVSALKDLPYLNPLAQALIIPGDFTSRGSEAEYQAFFDYLREYNKLPQTMVALGNHDVRWQDDPNIYRERYLKYNHDWLPATLPAGQLYWDRWIANYHFIVLNTEMDMKDNAYFSPAQLNWLQQKLSENFDPARPIFLSVHQAFKGTSDHIQLDRIYDPGQFSEDDPARMVNHEARLRTILEGYPNTVIFTGHVHNGRDLLRVYARPFGHVVDLPSFVRADYGAKGCCDAYQVTVDGKKVNLKLRNYQTNNWIKQNEITFSI